MLLYTTITLLLVTSGTRADYDCVCNYNTDLEVYTTADVQSAIVGRMYEFDCKPRSIVAAPTSGFLAVQFENKVGYVTLNDQVQVQTCSGQPSPDDLVSTTSTASTTTTSTKQTVVTSMEPVMTTRITTPPRTYKTTTRGTTTRLTTTIPPTTRRSTPQLTTTRQTIPPTTRKSTPQLTTTTQTKVSSTMAPISSTRPSTVISTTQHTVIKDHIEACPDHVRTDVNLKGGFLGQYGDFCFEVVDWLRPFDAAESHCKITSGHLVAITNQQEQEYINGLMARNHFVNASWIGLNDKAGEGVYSWTSGAPVTYKNFQGEFNQQSTQDHKLHDCFVIKQGGEWSDVPCGLAISFLGIGESHPFICQYNISAKVQSLFEIIPEFVG